MVEFVDIALLVLLGITAFSIIRQKNLFAAVMMASIYRLGTLALVGHSEHQPQHRPILPLLVVILTGAVLVYGTLDIPPFGDASNPAHHHVAPHYLEESEHEIGIPNVVTSVLASYRGYDTMGETTVIFAALVGVLLLLSLGLDLAGYS